MYSCLSLCVFIHHIVDIFLFRCICSSIAFLYCHHVAFAFCHCFYTCVCIMYLCLVNCLCHTILTCISLLLLLFLFPYRNVSVTYALLISYCVAFVLFWYLQSASCFAMNIVLCLFCCIMLIKHYHMIEFYCIVFFVFIPNISYHNLYHIRHPMLLQYSCVDISI